MPLAPALLTWVPCSRAPSALTAMETMNIKGRRGCHIVLVPVVLHVLSSTLTTNKVTTERVSFRSVMFCAIPAFGIFGPSLAQKVEDSGETIGDINAPDPELVPLERAFQDVSISTDGYPDYRYAALQTPSTVRLLELWATEPPKQESGLTGPYAS